MNRYQDLKIKEKENKLTDQEIEELELIENDLTGKTPDALDLLEDLRKLLNESHLEQLKYFKNNSPLGKNCSYYQKSKLIYDRNHRLKVRNLIQEISDGMIDGSLND